MAGGDRDEAPLGGRRGYPRTMTVIMVVVALIIIVVAVVQWVRV